MLCNCLHESFWYVGFENLPVLVFKTHSLLSVFLSLFGAIWMSVYLHEPGDMSQNASFYNI